ncbi:Cell division cycle protein 48-like protein MJ1156 [Frankliniella fusca]|uniref:Cell division cycle protein 48-like protein MJ1156 n=1 Tax=Frankliniella fusca TaxID=407009 RepID=A0AAE1HQF2_9NEOP|nr:Cell division cycle protein 48-like protein MJ1156 [Frankliniella fusca]
MARLLFTSALLVALCWAATPTLGVAPTNDSSEEIFSDYVEEDGDRLGVADPKGDPSESDSIQQDSTAEWQTEMVQNLFKQRKAEKDFIDKLEIGGKTLNEMVSNITLLFNSLEAARQQKGSQLIKEHFENELKLLKQSQAQVLSNLKNLLASQQTDSPALKSMKGQVQTVVVNNFKQQIQDEKELFKKQIGQIKQEHSKQIAHVKQLFALINNWKNAFRTGLKKSEKHLAKIAQSWDML